MANPEKYDLAVCCRIYPGVSRDPIFGFKDKLALTRLNLETFKEGVGDLKIKLWVLLDNCPPAYAELVKSIFPGTPVELIPLAGDVSTTRLIARSVASEPRGPMAKAFLA